MLAVTSEFNHSSKDYVNYDSTNLSAQIQKSKQKYVTGQRGNEKNMRNDNEKKGTP